MPLVEETIEIQGQKDEIFAIISNFGDYPKYMDGVKSVDIIEEGEAGSVSKWVTDVDGRSIIWTERDKIDADNYRIEFDKVEGDLKVFNGFWQVEDSIDGSDQSKDKKKVTFSIYFEFGIPMLSALLHPLLAKKLRENMTAMLAAIKVRVEGSGEPNSVNDEKTNEAGIAGEATGEVGPVREDVTAGEAQN